MNKSKQLEKLLKRWQSTHSSYTNDFRCDGITNEREYERSKPRILFICKEPNRKNHRGKIDGDFCKEWNDDGAEYPFAYRIAEWSYGILNDFPEFDKIYSLQDGEWEPIYKKSLQSISFMNLKKSSGKGAAQYSQMSGSVKKEKKLIYEQIRIIAPEVIILGLSWKDLTDELFDKVEWKESGFQILVGKWNETKLIDFYHPSSRTPPSASYSLLQNVVRSKVFQRL